MKKTLIISLTMAVLALILLLYAFQEPKQSGAISAGPVVLAVQNDTGSFVLQVKQGAQKAAGEVGSDFFLEIITADTAKEIAQKWRDKKASAALLYIKDKALLQTVQKAFTDQHIPLALLLAQCDALPCVQTNEKQAGELLGRRAAGYESVYIWGDFPERLTGALSALDETQKLIMFQTPTLKAQNACVLCLTAQETARLSQLKQQGVFDLPLFGMDPGEDMRVSLLEQNLLNAVVCQTPYAMGYTAVGLALKQEAAVSLLPYTLVEQKDMYAAENIKCMFPLLN